MSAMIYFIVMIVVGFFAFKYQEENFNKQAHKWEFDYRKGEGRIISSHDVNAWLERKSTWIVIVIAIVWPILVPAVGIIFILEYFYKKINNTKNKTDEKITPEHEITNDDTISDPHYN